MKRVIFLLFAAGFCLSAVSQITFVNKPNNPYKFLPDDSWNLNVLIPQPVEAIFFAEIQKSGTGVVASLESVPYSLRSGMNNLSRLVLETNSLRFSNHGIQQWYETNNSLPAGNYNICIKARCAEADCSGLGAGYIAADLQFCFSVQVELPTPLLLNFPGNEAVIKDKTPTLAWIPPSPVSPEVTYRLKLVEMQEGQSWQDAIVRNRPLLERDGLSGNILPFPADIDPLTEGSTYAWEVYAVLFNENIARSEVWQFTVGKDSVKKKEENFNYIKVRQLTPGSKVIVQNVLRLDYHEQVAKESAIRVEILTDKGVIKATFDQKVVYGENLLSIDLAGTGLKPGTVYTARITTPKGEKYEVKFEYSFSY